MCGLIGAFNTGKEKTPVNEAVLAQFEDQEARGIKGFGIMKIFDDFTYKIDRATEPHKFMWDIHQDPVSMIMMHHRIPTSTENKMAQTHPIIVDNGSLKYKYAVIHNGVVSNDDELYKEHCETLGFVYTTYDLDKKKNEYRFNDSECVAIEVARFIEGQIDTVGIQGSCAFICIQIDKKTNKVKQLFFGRNEGNPLNMAKTRGKLFLSSTGPGDEVKPFTLYSCKLDADMDLNRKKMPFKEAKPVITTVYNKNWSTWSAKDYKSSHIHKNYYDDYDSFYGETTKPRALPIEAEKDEEPAIAGIIDEYNEEIQGHLDLFSSYFDDPDYTMNMDEQDIDTVLDDMRTTMRQMIKEAKDYYTNQALETETKETIPEPKTVGFTV